MGKVSINMMEIESSYTPFGLFYIKSFRMDITVY